MSAEVTHVVDNLKSYGSVVMKREFMTAFTCDDKGD